MRILGRQPWFLWTDNTWQFTLSPHSTHLYSEEKRNGWAGGGYKYYPAGHLYQLFSSVLTAHIATQDFKLPVNPRMPEVKKLYILLRKKYIYSFCCKTILSIYFIASCSVVRSVIMPACPHPSFYFFLRKTYAKQPIQHAYCAFWISSGSAKKNFNVKVRT